MIGLIMLVISGILLSCETYVVFIGLEKKEFVYNDEQHSIEHLAYLMPYITSLIMGILSWYKVIPESYFYFTLGSSGVLLWYHIRKERKNKS